MIRTFKSKESEEIYFGRSVRRFQHVARVAQRKLKQINAAVELSDLTIFPDNRLEALKGDRKSQHSIRINDRYRVCFVWRKGDAYDVEVADYH